MSFQTNWNVDKYRTDTEPPHHWQLRKNFMLAHRDKFPEDRVVCLAQVYHNVETMACTYPKKVMQLIEDLGKEVPDVKQDGATLKRTLVGASDAAESKVKRTGWADVKAEAGPDQSSSAKPNETPNPKSKGKYPTVADRNARLKEALNRYEQNTANHALGPDPKTNPVATGFTSAEREQPDLMETADRLMREQPLAMALALSLVGHWRK